MQSSMAHVEPPPVDLERAKRYLQSPIIPEVTTPLVEDAARNLREMVRREGWDPESSVVEDLVDHFRETLARITNLVLVQRYASFHLVQNPVWRPPALPPGQPEEAAPRGMLERYIEWEEIEKILSPDGPYPALAALLSTCRRNWLSGSRELLLRAARRRAEIAAIIGVPEASLGPLTGLRFGVSDPHNDGRTVAVLRFGARSVVYKPRPLDAELAFHALLGRVIEAVMGLPARAPRIWTSEDHGFMEFIHDEECDSEDAVQRCYYRYGALTAVAHAIGAIDLHHENVIVSGEHPVAIDCEPLFRARLATSATGRSRLEVEQNLSLADFDVRESVLELGLLPTAMRMAAGPGRDGKTQEMQEIDIGALCAYAAAPFKETLPCAVGTDHVHMRSVRVVARAFPSLPRLAGEPRLPAAYLDPIIAGFEDAHRHLCEHKAEFTSEGGLLDRFSRCRVRLLVRPTMDYMNALMRSLAPEVLRSPEKRRELISRDMRDLSVLRMDTVGDLVPLEIESLVRGDIPFFSLPANSSECEGARLFSSPLAASKARLGAMDDFDRVMQVAQIREQLLRRDEAIVRTRPESMDIREILRHALTVGEAVASAAIEHEGAPAWVYAAYAPGVSSTMAHMDREALYEGCAGTALALAEIGALAGRADLVNLAVRVFDPIVERGQKPRSVSRGGGMGRGLGGLIYALVRVGRASGREALLGAAHRLALEYGGWLTEQEELNEVLHGRAGFVLALLSLYRSFPEARLKDLASEAVERVIRGAKVRDGEAFWPLPGGGELPNPSHGSSGVAMALARWAAMSGDDRAGKLALMALRHDDRFWVEAERGWADGRFQHVEMPERTNWSWCNGRSGGLLARLAVSEALGAPFVTETVERALDAAESDVLTDVSPGLCCGTAGAVDALSAVCRRHHHGGLDGAFERAAAAMVKGSPKNHYLTLSGSLFTGTAGLAFSLLRAACPDQVESVLWFA